MLHGNSTALKWRARVVLVATWLTQAAPTTARKHIVENTTANAKLVYFNVIEMNSGTLRVEAMTGAEAARAQNVIKTLQGKVSAIACMGPSVLTAISHFRSFPSISAIQWH